MSAAIKVGDRVRAARGPAETRGQVGTVTETDRKARGGSYDLRVDLDGGPKGVLLDLDEVERIDPEPEPAVIGSVVCKVEPDLDGFRAQIEEAVLEGVRAALARIASA